MCSGATGRFNIGVCRVRNAICDVYKSFRNNGIFVIDPDKNRKLLTMLTNKRIESEKKNKNVERDFNSVYKEILLEVEDQFDHGHLLFPTEDETDIQERVGGYKTYFGPVFYGGFLCYAKESVCNLEKALTRLTCCREADKLGYDEALCRNQDLAFRRGSWFWLLYAPYFSWMRNKVLTATRMELGEVHDEIKKDSMREHPKKKLRVSSFAEIMYLGTLYTYNFVTYIRGKIKCPEWAKPGKFPRMIGDYTCPGSLLGGALLACIKTCLTDWYITDTMRSIFVYSANYERLCEVFSYLLEDAGGNVFAYHSDDMVCKLRCVDGYARFNVDIKSCDASNGRAIFHVLRKLMSQTYWFDVMCACIEQCGLDFVIRNPRNPKEKITLSSQRPFEFSGTVLTTMLNNVAMGAICIVIDFMIRGKSRVEAKGIVERAAASLGYLVSIEEVLCDEDFQFLKISPTRVNGVVEVFLNLGVVLRSLGTCDGDLPGRGSIESRAELRNSGIVQGFLHAGKNIIMDALRQRFHFATKAINTHYIVDNMSGFERAYVSVEALSRRYAIAGVHLEWLAREIIDSQIGDVIANDALRQIFKKDYGM